MAILNAHESIESNLTNEIDLAALDCSNATDFFMLKFLLCNDPTNKSKLAETKEEAK